MGVWAGRGFDPESISISDERSFTPIKCTHGMSEASSRFSIGRNIYFIPFSLANITEGRIALTLRSFPSRASSPTKRLFSIYSSRKSCSRQSIPIAMGRSKLGPFLRISAGARLTVMRVEGNANHEFFRALRTRSLLSCIAVSGSPTILKAGIPLLTSSSTSILFPERPFTDTEKTFENISSVVMFIR